VESPTDKLQAQAAASAADDGSGQYVSDRTLAVDALGAVLTVNKALAGNLDIDHVLNVAVSAVADIIGAEGSSILLIDPESGGMTFHIAAGPGAEVAMTIPLPPGAGICGQVAASGEPLVINDAQNDPRLYRNVDNATGITTKNILCVPLHSDERLWGVLELINKHDDVDFDTRDLRLAEAVGGQIALALANAHLHTAIVRKERMAAIGQTVSGLAHCVKNVLNGIRSGSAVVDRNIKAADFEKVVKGWEVVRRNNNMLSNLVLDMLSLAREATFHPFPTDLNDLADQICQLLVERAKQRDIEITCVQAEGMGDVMTDPTQLYRCLLNLATNAVDACNDGGHVRVRVCDGRGRATLSVTDDGEGIKPEDRSKLFAEFFTTKGSHGTGLGLPVTRKLITAMGGKIVFHSVRGKGTRFVIALPNEEKETNS